jgi:hypothetical protein
LAVDLDLVRSNLEFTLGELLDYLATPRRVEVEAAAVQKICDVHRRIGICHLLAEADAPPFFAHLSHSANAYLATMRKVRWDGVVDLYYLCASRAAPFFDALAGANLQAAVAIGSHSRSTWAEGDEYEDDFAYVRTVMALLGGGAAPASDAHAWVDRLRGAAGEDDPRTGVCAALRDGAATDFEAALRRLAAAYATRMDDERKNGAADPNELATEGRLFVQGAALARLALLRGIEVERKFRLVPEAAYRKPVTVFPDVSTWRASP